MTTRFPEQRDESPTLFSAPAALGDRFGIYVHIPFCAHLCPYCDFNTYTGQEFRIPAYVEALQQEIDVWAPRFTGRTAGSIFIGGGTPSLLTPDLVSTFVASCRGAFDVSADAEITIEANPNDVDERLSTGLLAAGVNRISIGAQTLDRRGLRVLGRLHEATHTANAVRQARQAGFESLSLDFIYGWPGHTTATWQDELDRVLNGEVGGSPPDHLSLYGLIVEPGTPMANAVNRGILTPVDDDVSADLYELAVETLAEAGWVHYEISNWTARPEHASWHNALYWRNGEYVGLGAGAHGYWNGQRFMNQPSPRRYIELLREGQAVASNIETIDQRTSMGETMMLGLRLLGDGISIPAFRHRHGRPLTDAYGTLLTRFASLGLLEVNEARVRLTQRGSLLANSVCAEFL
jgi:oxygen-independent coproporphyrinogen-3 oxidase